MTIGGRASRALSAPAAAGTGFGAVVARIDSAGRFVQDTSIALGSLPTVGPGDGALVSVKLPGSGVFAFRHPGDSGQMNATFPLTLEPGGVFSGIGTWNGSVFSAEDVSVEPAPLPLPRP